MAEKRSYVHTEWLSVQRGETKPVLHDDSFVVTSGKYPTTEQSCVALHAPHGIYFLTAEESEHLAFLLTSCAALHRHPSDKVEGSQP